KFVQSLIQRSLHITSCSNGKITVGHRFAIIANHYFPLSKALVCTQVSCSILNMEVNSNESSRY
ncbi:MULTISPECIES: hypothetical protein, partial [unclassified Colwellia]|uniref:hypothetical protein n=1 Tax=unclassified Colwellia TaxID=196834 RepID=UPI001C71523C